MMNWYPKIRLTTIFVGMIVGFGSVLMAGENFGGIEAAKILLRQLDSNSCQRRNSAWNQLSEQAVQVAEPQILLHEVQEELKKSTLSFEALARLEKLENVLQERLKNEVEVQEELKNTDFGISEEESIPEKLHVWKKLVGKSPVERNQAEREIRALIQKNERLRDILEILREMVVQETLEPDDRYRIWKLEQLARKKWLKSGEQTLNSFLASETQLKESVDFLATANLPEDQLALWFDFDERTRSVFLVNLYQEPFGGDGLTFLEIQDYKTGKREGLKVWKTVQNLEDALVCEQTRVQTLQLINEKLNSESVTPAGTILLKRLQFLTRPCMAAEYWPQGTFLHAQILQIGVPQKYDVGVSFFDSSTDETVHCQQGANLGNRDYPWGVAILNPNNQDAFFHLVPLKTVKSKLLYASQIVENQEERLRLISEKTFQTRDWNNVEKKELVNLLFVLDARVASRQAGAWLAEPEMDQYREKIEIFLNEKGTREAVPALLAQLENGVPSWYELNVGYKMRLDWMAALNIAQRDPWEGVEIWLKKQVNRNEALLEKDETFQDSPVVIIESQEKVPLQRKKVENCPTVSATAEAILCKMEGKPLEGLKEAVVGFYRSEK